MSAPTPDSPPPAAPKRRRFWLLVPLMLLLAALVCFAWAYRRGTTFETQERNPAKATDPPVSQLQRGGKDEGDTTIRAAVIIARPRQAVLDLVTDFDHYGDVFGPYLKDVKSTEIESGREVKGEATSLLGGSWKFRMMADPPSRRGKAGAPVRLKWVCSIGDDEQYYPGRWTLIELSPTETLLVLRLDAEVKGVPTWLLRNVLLHRTRECLRLAKKHLEAGGN